MTSGQRVGSGNRCTRVYGIEPPNSPDVRKDRSVVHPMGDERLGCDHRSDIVIHTLHIGGSAVRQEDGQTLCPVDDAPLVRECALASRRR